MTTALGASGTAAHAALPARNPGTPLDLSLLTRTRINRSAVERRAATLTTRRTVKKEWQAAWLLRAVSVMDLTTLAGDDTPGNVQRLCAKARQPVRDDLLEALGMAGRGLRSSPATGRASTTRCAPSARRAGPRT
jgi:deoxyribose-phosphate aldolase